MRAVSVSVHSRVVAAVALAVLAVGIPASGGYRPAEHRTALTPGEIPVTRPGMCDKEGATYVLMNDISSPTSALFLAGNVTLDLNGYTITYADGGYRHVTNMSFEDGLAGWDTSKAPGAAVRDTEMLHPMHGKKTCLLPKDQEIVSSYVELPVARRTYFATAMVARENQYVTVNVEDGDGKPVQCTFTFGKNQRLVCPLNAHPPKLGGGTVYAMIYGMPAGKYRVRVKAIGRDAVIDCVDIRPAMDVGVGIVDRVIPWAYYKCVLDGDELPAFFDYLKPGATFDPIDGLPRVTGPGTITIKNGVIRNGARTIRSRGILSTAAKSKTVIQNVKIVAAGITANAVRVHQAVMKDCRVEVDTPFLIERHNRVDTACSLGGPSGPSEVLDCEFIGGQGCVTIHGEGGEIRGNLFRGNQTVTNHYSLCLDAEGVQVHHNRFEPICGSGISLFGTSRNEIHDNTFKITAAPPNNEYSEVDYSTNAIRITDYNATKGKGKGHWCEGNRIYRNKFDVTSKSYEGAHKNYQAVATVVFMSVGGGPNDIHDNEIVLRNLTPGQKGNQAWAFYIGGSNQGGNYYNNTITTNVQPIWVSCRYGKAKNVTMYGNTIVKAEGAEPFVPIQCGFWKSPSEEVGFYSNRFVGVEFGVEIGDYTTKSSQYEFGWTLTVRASDGDEVQVLDDQGNKVASRKVGPEKKVSFHLAEYRAKGSEKTVCNQYVVKVGDFEKKVTLQSDMEVNAH